MSCLAERHVFGLARPAVTRRATSTAFLGQQSPNKGYCHSLQSVDLGGHHTFLTRGGGTIIISTAAVSVRFRYVHLVGVDKYNSPVAVS